MENRFKSKTKASDFGRVLLLNAVAEHPNAFPVVGGECGIVVSIQCRALEVFQESEIISNNHVLLTIPTI